jgi:hypothetical protein
MSSFEVLQGSLGLSINDVAHVLVPGRGRNDTGDGLSARGLERAHFAATFYLDQQLEERGGVIVPTGYKTPADKAGNPWRSSDNASELYTGIPEAESMRQLFLSRGIGKSAIRAERNSFDTVTNFVYAENHGHFPDDKPVAIISQEQHLERMIKLIAPKTLRRDYLGIIVPEGAEKDADNIFAKSESYAVLLGIKPDSHRIVQKTTKRASTIWLLVNFLQRN